MKNIWEIENNPLFSSGPNSQSPDTENNTPGSTYARLLPNDNTDK